MVGTQQTPEQFLLHLEFQIFFQKFKQEGEKHLHSASEIIYWLLRKHSVAFANSEQREITEKCDTKKAIAANSYV